MINITNKTSKIDDIFKPIVNDIVTKKSIDYSESFNIKDLPDNDGFRIHPNTLPEFDCLYRPLDKKNKDCLYWFELESIEKAIELNNILNTYRLSNKKGNVDYRNIPATNKNETSNVLYVGIRRKSKANKPRITSIVGRINQHLGYYKNQNTQGLQLIHFAKNCDFKVTLNVVEIISENDIYLNIIEKKVADKLKPLCGRH
ncbi:hypothetical protein N9954_05725 [Maribacter sp.]|nr:hypothetical protein [Maribacter sp.]